MTRSPVGSLISATGAGGLVRLVRTGACSALAPASSRPLTGATAAGPIGSAALPELARPNNVAPHPLRLGRTDAGYGRARARLLARIHRRYETITEPRQVGPI